jgi:hypothetical protein
MVAGTQDKSMNDEYRTRNSEARHSALLILPSAVHAKPMFFLSLHSDEMTLEAGTVTAISLTSRSGSFQPERLQISPSPPPG